MRNPILPGFHPDPSICRAGEDYYLVCSSFEYFPGLPVFHSRDLESWRQIGNALDRPSQLPLPADTPASGGIFAPTIRHHDGRFWIITTNTSGGGNFIVSATDPAGPWSEPAWIDLPGIDPDLAWDDDGTCWCTVSGTQVARIDPVAGKIIDGPFPGWQGTGLQYPEAPHLYRIGDWWYLMIAEGGTERGHTVAMARARSPRGPFEAAPGNPILTHRSTNRPVQSTGHADLVSTPGGDWWMVLLATRPKGNTPGFHVLGRETFLAPVRWVDGWPEVDPIVEEPAPFVATSDHFDGPALAPAWISPRGRPGDAWSLTDRPGWLTLHATGPSLDEPRVTFIGRRQEHHSVRVTARLDPGTARAGLSIRIDEDHHYDLEVGDGQARVVARIGPLRQVFGEQPVPAGPVDLVVETRPNQGTGPDTVVFRVGAGPILAELDGRYLSTEVATGFTGRVIGMYVTRGSAAFDFYDQTGIEPSV
ncbi:glycoside hydrolase family 43 protein [Paractinoplanes durhamensis]|uniref:Glycoside hydrolase 43 family protein n=1 Tax=Paractinoplanes durhamensis TaxID=113563 RepID=A0ABQ3YUA8_9ACTN|nr:glycoside hydrolase family 43 protein [Actinoplanes durhamensis]GIE01200.1 glycoside hydrolase 43 family protein [Actinoplanes durhamensis]